MLDFVVDFFEDLIQGEFKLKDITPVLSAL